MLDRHVDRLKQEYGDKYIFTDNADEVLEDKDIDIIVELLGREHPAKEFIARAFANGKHVVTANKDVLAKFGAELFPLAHEHNCDFMFEASVCGGITYHWTFENQYGSQSDYLYHGYRERHHQLYAVQDG